MRMNFSMQSGLFDPKHARPVTVFGAGSVGSNLIDMIARIGVEQVEVWDGDAVESHNIPSSRFGVADLGKFKVDALASRILNDTGMALRTKREFYDGSVRLRGSIVSCVDTMEARKLIWSKVRHNPLVDVFIDTRIAKKFFTVFCIRPCVPDDIAHYEHFLYDDADTHTQGCGTHGIISATTMVASEAVERLCGYWHDGSIRLQTEGICGGERFPITPLQKEA